MTEARRVGVVVVLTSCLVGVPGIEGDALVDIGVTIPNVVTVDAVSRTGIGAVGIGVGKGIAVVKHGHTIHVKTGSTESRA